MRIPKAWDDESLLEDEPFLSHFNVLVLAENKRRNTTAGRLKEIAIGLELEKAEQAARKWVEFAFASHPNEVQRKVVKFDAETRLLFVEFYWRMFQEKDIEQGYAAFLRQERKKRGFQYALEQGCRVQEPSASPMKKRGHSSHRVTTSSKRQILGGQRRTPSMRPNDIPKDSTSKEPASRPVQLSRAGFEGNRPFPARFKEATKLTSRQTQTSSRPSGSVRSTRQSARISAPPVLKSHTSRPSPSRPSVSSLRTGFSKSLQNLPSSHHQADTAMNVEALPPTLSRPSPPLATQAVHSHPAKVGIAPDAGGTSVFSISICPPCPTAVLFPNSPNVEPDQIAPPDQSLLKQTEMSIKCDGFAAPTPGEPTNSWAPHEGTLHEVPTSPTTTLPSPEHSGAIEIGRLEGTAQIELTGAPRSDASFTFHVAPTMQTPLSCRIRNYDEASPPVSVAHRLPSSGSGEFDSTVSPPMEDQLLHGLGVALPSRPPLPKYPPIWAQSRQEVCESFDWFRSYQGGVYHARNFVKGYLLSAFSSKRDLFEHDGHLIISHGGGKAESLHSHNGKWTSQPAGDQLAHDKSVRALLANYRESRPLVLLIDDKYVQFPYNLAAKEVTYAVLGFYTISHVWAEYQPANTEQGRVVRYKFAFRWCEGQESLPVHANPLSILQFLQGEPWWIPRKDEQSNICLEPQLPSGSTSATVAALVKLKEVTFPSTLPTRPDGIYFLCGVCNQSSPHVYRQAWACLNSTCAQFWVTREGTPMPAHLDYNHNFLRLSAPHILPPDLRDVRPSPPEASMETVNTTYAFSRGLHCRKCGRLSCRYKWEHWECMHCGVKVGFPGRIRLPSEFWKEKLPDRFLNHHIRETSGIVKESLKMFRHETGMGQIQTFILPEGRGRIHQIQSVTPRGNTRADSIFHDYQEDASAGRLQFRRWPMRAHKCRGSLLTNYFSQNSGEPYQYVGGTANTIPFSDTSNAVVKARDLIQTRIRQALGMSIEFNEVLSAAYMERQKMAFHSDSERGLGPFVAGLSLGSPALMHFRAHRKFRLDEEAKTQAIALTVVLRHGDILVMDGDGVQEGYEHTVIPTNFRIAATARSINVTTRIEDIPYNNINLRI